MARIGTKNSKPAQRTSQVKVSGATKTKQRVTFLQQDSTDNMIIPRVRFNATHWVYFGEINDFPQVVAELAISPIHSSILKIKEEMAYGKGFVYDESNIALAEFLKNEYSQGGFNPCNDVMRLVMHDYIVYGGYYLGVYYDSCGRIARLEHIPFNQMRVGHVDEHLNIRTLYRSVDWLYQYGINHVKRHPHPIFNPKTWEEDEGYQIYYYRDYSDTTHCYPMPDYYGVRNYIEADKLQALFHLKNIAHGFLPSAIITLPSEPTEEEKIKLVKELDAFQSGPENAGKFILLHGDPDVGGGGSQIPTVVPFNTTANADIYNETNQLIVERILSGHGFPPTLAGVTSSSLSIAGNSEEIVNSYELVMNNIIKKYQQNVLKGFKRLMGVNKIDTESLEILSEIPVSFRISVNMLDALDKGVFTINEVREMLGYEASTQEVAEEVDGDNKPVVPDSVDEVDYRPGFPKRAPFPAPVMNPPGKTAPASALKKALNYASKHLNLF